MMGNSGGTGLGLRMRVTAVSLFPMLVVLLVLGGLVYQQYARNAFDERRERATALLESFAVSSSIAVATQNLENLDANMIRMAQVGGRLHGMVHVAMLDHRGNVLAQAYSRDEDDLIMAPPREVPQRSFYDAAIQTEEGHWKLVEQSDGSPLLALSVPTVSGLRWGTLVGYFEMTSHFDSVQQVAMSLVWITCTIAFVMTLGLMWGLWRSVVRPVRSLALAAARVRNGDLTTRVESRRTDEIGQLADSFNTMTEELEVYTRDLEVRVEDRTRELHEKNKELEEVNARLEVVVQQLDRLARIDRLTGVANRGHIMEILAKELSRSVAEKQHFSLLMVDVDHFKSFNDTFGHQVGDQVLIETAKRMGKVLRGRDSIGRYGGEEFIILLPKTDREGARVVGENLREKVSASPFTDLDGNPVGTVTVSGGLACFPEDGQTAEALVQVADGALYRSKAEGRNRIS